MSKFDSAKISKENFVYQGAHKNINLIRQYPDVFKPIQFSADREFNLHTADLTNQPGGSYKIYPIGLEALHHYLDNGKTNFTMASPGNGGLALANVSARFGLNPEIIVPIGTSRQRINQLISLGAEVKEEGATFDEAFKASEKSSNENGRHFVHPYNADHVLIGDGILGIEIAEYIEKNNVDTLIVPIGGGGLSSGIVSIVKQKNPKVKIIGVQSEKNTAMIDSIQSDKLIIRDAVKSISHSTAVGKPGEIGLEILKDGMDETVKVSEESIAKAMGHYKKQGKVVEGAGALTLAAIIEGKVKKTPKTMIVISGANK